MGSRHHGLAAGLAGLLSLGGSLAHAQVLWQGDDLRQGLQRATRESKLLLLDFYAEWCGPCMTLDSVVWSRADTAQTVAEGFVPLRFDADSTQGAAMVRRFGVGSLPMVLVLRADGSELDRLGGAALDADILYASVLVWKRGETALSVLLSRAQRRPDDLALRYEVGLRYATQGNDVLSHQWLDRLVVLDPDNARGFAAKALLALGETLELSTRHDPMTALGSLRTLVQRWPDTEAGVKGRMALSLALHQTGDETGALRELDTLQNTVTELTRTGRWTQLAGMLHRARWELPRAERLARAVLQGSNRSAQALNLLAEILCAEGQMQEAAELERQALAQDPGNEYYAAQLQCFQEALRLESGSRTQSDAGVDTVEMRAR